MFKYEKDNIRSNNGKIDHIHQGYIFFIILDNLYDLLWSTRSYKLSRIIKKLFAGKGRPVSYSRCSKKSIALVKEQLIAL